MFPICKKPSSWSALLLPAVLTAAEAPSGALAIDAQSFRCIREMTPVRHFYVDNVLGNVSGTLAAANAPGGAIYPPGSVIQLVPTEAMVKREAGFSPATGDWEFFELDVAGKENRHPRPWLCRG